MCLSVGVLGRREAIESLCGLQRAVVIATHLHSHLPESIGLVSIIAMGFACTDVQVCLVSFSVEHSYCHSLYVLVIVY